jgi:hypothetical protein
MMIRIGLIGELKPVPRPWLDTPCVLLRYILYGVINPRDSSLGIRL